MSEEKEYLALVNKLLVKRNSIISNYDDKIKTAEINRDAEVLQNTESLIRIGVKMSDIPKYHTSSKFRKLSDNIIQSTLSSYMRQGEFYSSTTLLDRLKISYPDLRTFVRKNPTFISRSGCNKGMKYFLV
jgi:hypothetical protein